MSIDGLTESLVRLLKTNSVQRGEFVLSSGRRSSYYVDARRTTMSAAGLDLIGRLGTVWIRELGWKASGVGGLTIGADPVAYAIALASRESPPILDAFTVRKEPKAHGTGQLIEGCFAPGSHVVVVEDVLTTGGSALRAIEAVRAAGGVPVGVLGVVDREEGGLAAIRERGIPARAMVSIRELGIGPA
jgi:orotate phosphoribosyltransferase